jgi:Putative metallopeptidase
MSQVTLARLTLPCAVCFSLAAMPSMAAAAPEEANRIRIEYFAPKNAAYGSIYERLKDRRALERLQGIFSPLRLPFDLTLRTGDCGGLANGWYNRPVITVCYEYVNDFLKTLPQEATPEGITPMDAAVGQFFYVFAHEMGHAVFDVFHVPIFGRAEDATDQFATYIMLQFGQDQARRLIGGAAYAYHMYVQNPQVTTPLAAFSDVHGAPAQRFYNLICLAYGANPTVFADVVDKGYLPKERARDCKGEYDQAAFAFRDLIEPHVDQKLKRQVLDRTWLPPEGPWHPPETVR